MDMGSDQMIKFEDKLKVLLTPQYMNLFKLIGRLEKGVKFLVDMRTDVLVCCKKHICTNSKYYK